MNGLLERLRAHTRLPLNPDDVLVLRNVGGFGEAPEVAEDHVSTRGFNLLLLAPDGEPRHYVKCRRSGHPRALREAGILLALGTEPALAAHVPVAAQLDAGRVMALVMDYQPGADLQQALRHRDWNSRLELLRQVLGLAEAAAEVVGRNNLAASPVTAADCDVTRLAALLPDLDPAGHARMQALLSQALALPARLQHGDLTARNVRLSQGRLVLLDFEAFGEIRLPLADAWNLVRNLPRSGSWSLHGRRWWQGPGLRLVEEQAEKLALGAAGLPATLVGYLAIMAAMLARRGVPRAFVRPYLDDLRAVLSDEP